MKFPQTVVVDVNGAKYQVVIGENNGNNTVSATTTTVTPGTGDPLESPLEGKFYLRKNPSDPAVKVGDIVKKGQTICFIEAMKTFNAISAMKDGVISEICYKVETLWLKMTY